MFSVRQGNDEACVCVCECERLVWSVLHELFDARPRLSQDKTEVYLMEKENVQIN